MNDPVNRRKRDHLRSIEEDAGIERFASGFDALRLTHRALPEIDFDKINTETQFLGKTLSFPLLISSMTGGDSDEILAINRRLAEAAEETGVAMAVGSQRVMFTTPAARESFDLRKFAPNVPLISNMGAVQLNYGIGTEHLRECVDILGADALYLHLNPLQEAVQPEGDRNFAGLSEKIAEVITELNVPVMLKEVGSGLSTADIERTYRAGIRHFDLAGRGGTSWSRIEYHRRNAEDDTLGLVFQDWGLTTVEALEAANTWREAQKREPVTLIASGGVRNGIDMAKALLLGAQTCGIAAPFLAAAQDSTGAVVRQIERIKKEFQTALFLLGCADCKELIGNKALLVGKTTQI